MKQEPGVIQSLLVFCFFFSCHFGLDQNLFCQIQLTPYASLIASLCSSFCPYLPRMVLIVLKARSVRTTARCSGVWRSMFCSFTFAPEEENEKKNESDEDETALVFCSGRDIQRQVRIIQMLVYWSFVVVFLHLSLRVKRKSLNALFFHSKKNEHSENSRPSPLLSLFFLYQSHSLASFLLPLLPLSRRTWIAS